VGGTNNRVFKIEDKQILDETCFINCDKLVKEGFIVEIIEEVEEEKKSLTAKMLIEKIETIEDPAELIELLNDEERITVIGSINERLEELK
jgi:hypothetical protein